MSDYRRQGVLTYTQAFLTKLISSHGSVNHVHLKFLVFTEHTLHQFQEIVKKNFFAKIEFFK
jgi:hypothetical protein